MLNTDFKIVESISGIQEYSVGFDIKLLFTIKLIHYF